MIALEPLDGNSIAGDLYEVFGVEMTTAMGRCTNCGTEGMLAEVSVYMRAPGRVARCRNCDSVLFVLVDLGGALQLYTAAIELQSPGDR